MGSVTILTSLKDLESLSGIDVAPQPIAQIQILSPLL
jgi:hypothetical protein